MGNPVIVRFSASEWLVLSKFAGRSTVSELMTKLDPDELGVLVGIGARLGAERIGPASG